MTRVLVDRDTVNDDTVVVRKLYKRTGESVDAGALVLEYETSKTAIESYAPEAGVLALSVSEGDEIAVGALLYELNGAATVGDAPRTDDVLAAAAASVAASSHGALMRGEVAASVAMASTPLAGGVSVSSGIASVATAPAASLPVRVVLSNKAKALAEDLEVDVTKLARAGWVTAADIREAAGLGVVGAAAVPAVPAVRPGVALVSQPPVRAANNIVTAHQTAKTSVRKRTEARTLVRANSHGATSTIGAQIRIEGRRLARPPSLFSDNISDLVVFELARLLKRFPELNGFYVDEQRVGLYDEVNVGVSFDNGANLKVLALRNVDAKTLPQIQLEFTSLLELYESDRPIPADLLGSATVTLSDLSGTGADFMLPLINGDQSLIIGITRRSQGYGLHASFDHRVSEGLQVAKLLEELGVRIASHFSGVKPDPRCSACDRPMSDELALGHRGFLKIALPAGGEGQLCRSCFEGF